MTSHRVPRVQTLQELSKKVSIFMRRGITIFPVFFFFWHIYSIIYSNIVQRPLPKGPVLYYLKLLGVEQEWKMFKYRPYHKILRVEMVLDGTVYPTAKDMRIEKGFEMMQFRYPKMFKKWKTNLCKKGYKTVGFNIHIEQLRRGYIWDPNYRSKPCQVTGQKHGD